MASSRACCISGCSGSGGSSLSPAAWAEPCRTTVRGWLPSSAGFAAHLHRWVAPCFWSPPANGAAGSKLLPQQQNRSAFALLPLLSWTAWEEEGELAASWTRSSGNGSCSQPPFCPGVICLSHPRRVTLMWWESSQAAIRKSWGRVGAVAAARTVHLTPSLFLLHSRAVPREAGCWEQAAGLINCPVCHKSLRSVGWAPVSYSIQSSVCCFDNWIAFCPFSLCAYTEYKGGSRAYSIRKQRNSGNRDSSFPMAKCSLLPDPGQTTYTQLLRGVQMPTTHWAKQERKACALSGKGRCEYSIFQGHYEGEDISGLQKPR